MVSLQVVDANKDARKLAAAQADELLRYEQLSFEAWRDSLETVPTIKVNSQPDLVLLHNQLNNQRV